MEKLIPENFSYFYTVKLLNALTFRRNFKIKVSSCLTFTFYVIEFLVMQFFSSPTLTAQFLFGEYICIFFESFFWEKHKIRSITET